MQTRRINYGLAAVAALALGTSEVSYWIRAICIGVQISTALFMGVVLPTFIASVVFFIIVLCKH